ncbi:MAG: DUF89 family protein [Oscillospiraceae bacterium]|nr:DUF89 family protein [Oscillospiraceae bacterium]
MIRFDAECLVCQLRRQVEVARGYGDDERAMAFAKDLMNLYLTGPADVPSPWFVPYIDDLLHKHYDLPADRFREEKELSNRFVLERLDRIRAKVTAAEDPLYAGLQMAILGNYIDFSALQGEVSFDQLDQMLDRAATFHPDRDTFDRLCRELENARKLLYLTDNAGEIGFDRVFAEEIRKRYPHLEITFCVRGGLTMNDATRADAEAVGIPFPVIDNGSRVAGTQLDQLGEEAKRAMDGADVIISKGQGNAETLLGCGYNIYYAFLVKCSRFQSTFHKPKFTPMLVAERA